MITPGFFSFFNAQRGLITAQTALNTVNHNVANANTKGYSRQRVEISAFAPYTNPTVYGLTGGQLGQGSTVDKVIRVREQFLDVQFRQETSLLEYATTLRDNLQHVEGVFTEPSTSGINTAIQNFFDAAQEMSVHPESLAVRANFLQMSQEMLTVFQGQAKQLFDLRESLVGHISNAGSFAVSQANIMTLDVNEKLQGIRDLNKQIITIMASGAQPNDLFDARDKLIDELSELVDVDVTYLDNGQLNLSIANQVMVRGGDLVNTLEYVQNTNAATNLAQPGVLRTVNGGVVLNDGYTANDIRSGKLRAIFDLGQRDTANNPLGDNDIYSTIRKMRLLLEEVVNDANTVQRSGVDLNGNGVDSVAPPAVVNLSFLFRADPTKIDPIGDSNSLAQWVVNITDPRALGAAADNGDGTFSGVGDGRNALKMAQLRDGSNAGLSNSTYIEYFNSLISSIGIKGRTYEDRSEAQHNVVNSLDLRRDSISGVNIDEEMIDMLRFQRAFESSSKLISTFDEVVKTIINMV